MSQLPIPFIGLVEAFDQKRTKRYKFLRSKGISTENTQFLLKITFDLTDKDFEYLLCYLLEKDGFKTSMFGKFYRGIDIEAEKNGIKLFIQCKQLANAYVTESKAGLFIGNINQKIEKKSKNEYFYYVTTSYITNDAEAYFKKNNIITLSNDDLIKRCKKHGLLTDVGWKDLINYIREKRLLSISSSRRSNFTNVKEALKMQRLYEFCHHLPPNKRTEITTSILLADTKFINNFFEYWNLS